MFTNRIILLCSVLLTVSCNDSLPDHPIGVSPLHLVLETDRYLGHQIVIYGYLNQTPGGHSALYQTEIAGKYFDLSQGITVDFSNIADHLDPEKCIGRYVVIHATFAETEPWSGSYPAITRIENIGVPEFGIDSHRQCVKDGT